MPSAKRQEGSDRNHVGGVLCDSNEFDGGVQPFTSTGETSWRIDLFKSGLSQDRVYKNSSPDQLRKRERSRREGC